jgi:hypothetical protein
MNHAGIHRAVVAGPLLLLVSALGIAGCDQAPTDPAALASTSVTGPAAEGGSPEQGAVWQEAFVAWPREGNLSVLYGAPTVQGQMDAWMMGQVPPSPVPEIGVPVMEKVRAFNDRLIALDGGWGAMPASDSIRGMAVRGLRKTLWSDARLAVAEGDADRLVDVLVVMATLPRVSHLYDSTADGVLVTVGLVDGFTWAMGDATTPGFDIELDPAQCARLRQAASWVEVSSAFGVAAPEDTRRASILEQYETRTRPRVRELLAALCG